MAHLDPEVALGLAVQAPAGMVVGGCVAEVGLKIIARQQQLMTLKAVIENVVGRMGRDAGGEFRDDAAVGIV
ncbi:MAG: hypothetical protein E5W75_04970, partial [Mesorhizobium sp.]